jgi:hypothetical protein
MTALVQLKPVVGRGLWQKQALGLLFLSVALHVSAAPLDALLTATPEQTALKGYLEVGSDHMNQQLDFFNIRDTNALAAGTQAGDYHGAHLAGAWRVRDNAWLSGSLWQRNLNGLSETYDFTSWQVSGLYRLMEGAGKVPAMAVRLSAWGNYAGEVGANFPATAGVNVLFPAGTLLQTIKVTDPSDKNLQADLIGTWKLTPATDLSVLFGVGRTQLSYGEITGSLVQSGTPYQLKFMGNKIVGTAADGSQIGVPASNYGIDVNNELAWSGNFVQAGINAAWSHGPWTLRGGYLFYAVQRQGVDDILAARGWSAFTKTKTIALEANYRVQPNLSVFARSQLSSNLIFNEMPVAYNTFSADLFGGKYSIYTVGLRADF